MKRAPFLVALLILLASCAVPAAQPTSAPTLPVDLEGSLTAEEAFTLGSLQLVDDHPLYTLRYTAPYREIARRDGRQHQVTISQVSSPQDCPRPWGCSLFATLGSEQDRLYGRNFDWQFSPAVLLFTSPPDGYASVSMVDIEYLGFEGERSRRILDLSLEERRSLLDAPFLPFDGMNEKGLAVGMAAVPAQEMPHDPRKPTIDHLEVMREVLDHAATVEQALDVFRSYNIDMGNVPLHYLVASRAGDSAVVEFYQGNMVVFRNEQSWQNATNFLLASTDGEPEGNCPRYDRASLRLEQSGGSLSIPQAFNLLQDVSQDNTQWSIVYNMTTGQLSLAMGRKFAAPRHGFEIVRPGE